MTTTSNTGARKPATSRKTSAASGSTESATSAQPKTRVEQVQSLAERAVLVPVGATLLARDNLVATVRDLTTRYSTRSGIERELRRYERRGVTARNRFERQVHRTRTRVERELRQRRARVQRTVKQNRRSFERQVRAIRRDLEKQSETLTARVEKLVSETQDRLSTVS